MNPDSIPRYEQPAPDELARMYAEPTPGELYQSCVHHDVCRMWNPAFEGDDETLGAVLCCADCTEWEDA